MKIGSEKNKENYVIKLYVVPYIKIVTEKAVFPTRSQKNNYESLCHIYILYIMFYYSII